MATEKTLTYSETGVDIDIEAQAARILYEAAKQSWVNRKNDLGQIIVPYDDFSGIRFIRVANLPKGTVMYGGSDGIATKIDFAERANRYNTLGFDLMAMVCDDAVVRGGEPIAVKTVLTVNTLGQNQDRLPFIHELAEGYITAAKEAGVAIINGEIAQHNDRMGRLDRFSLDWSGDVTWFGNEERLITGFDIQPDDYLIGLLEEGPRSNGASLTRKALQILHGEQWEDITIDGEKIIDLALKPSRIYAKAVVDMFGGWNLKRAPRAILHGVAHISGGGLPEKLGRTLNPTGLGAMIDDPFTPPKLMTHCQQAGISDEEAYKTWSMGHGMVLISPNYEDVIEVANEHNIKAKVIGYVTKDPKIVINSKGRDGALLKY